MMVSVTVLVECRQKKETEEAKAPIQTLYSNSKQQTGRGTGRNTGRNTGRTTH